MREAIDRILRDPRRDARAAIGRLLLVDFRDIVQLRQHPRFFVRNLELQNFAAFELALPDQVDEIFDPAAGERGNVERRALSPSAGKSARRSTDVVFVQHLDHAILRDRQIAQDLLPNLGLLFVGRVDDMQDEIGADRLLHRRSERGHQVMRKLSMTTVGRGVG